MVNGQGLACWEVDGRGKSNRRRSGAAGLESRRPLQACPHRLLDKPDYSPTAVHSPRLAHKYLATPSRATALAAEHNSTDAATARLRPLSLRLPALG